MKGTDGTGGTVRGEAPWCALIDGIAAANRTAGATVAELQLLREAVVLLALLGALYVIKDCQ